MAEVRRFAREALAEHEMVKAEPQEGVGAVIKRAGQDRALVWLRTDEGVDTERIGMLRGKPLSQAAIAWLTEHALIRTEGARRSCRAGG